MIKLLEGETDQETFDFIVAKLREQGEPSFVQLTDSAVFCVYGKNGGSRCAVGHLMGDGANESASGIRNLVVNDIVEMPRSLTLLEDIQKAHDYPVLNDRYGNSWAKECALEMSAVAIRHRLDLKTSTDWYDHVQNQ
jgi:hypothetical protein